MIGQEGVRGSEGGVRGSEGGVRGSEGGVRGSGGGGVRGEEESDGNASLLCGQ